MPLYFFDSGTDCDQDGTELPSFDAARKEAGCCVGEMIRCASLTALPEQWAMNICDEGRRVLATLSFGVSTYLAA